MNENLLTESISRREMMKRTAIAAGALALLPSLSACEGDMNVETLSRQIRSSGTISADKRAILLELVRQASLAASGHNMQPWIFEIEDDKISILPDYARRLPVVDSQDRELWISLGCASENLVIAARAMGYAAEATNTEQGVTVQWMEGGVHEDDVLAAAIPLRQCNRAGYTMAFVSDADMEKLRPLTVHGNAAALFIQDGEDMKTLQSLVMEGDIQQYADAAFVNELVESLRFNKREALETRDGLFSACSGNPKVPRFIGKLFVKPGMGDQQAEKDCQLMDTASGLFLINTLGDTKGDWISAGRLYQRMALQMTNLGITHSFLNQPIELPALREEVQTFVEGGVKDNPWHEDRFRVPQLLLRYGYAAEPMPYSLRRPLDEVIQRV